MPVFEELIKRLGIAPTFSQKSFPPIYVNLIQNFRSALENYHQDIRLIETFTETQGQITTHMELYSNESLIASFNIRVESEEISGQLANEDKLKNRRIYLNVAIVFSATNQLNSKSVEIDMITSNPSHFQFKFKEIVNILELEGYCNNLDDNMRILSKVLNNNFTGITLNTQNFAKLSNQRNFEMDYEDNKLNGVLRYQLPEKSGEIGRYTLQLKGKPVDLDFFRMSKSQLNVLLDHQLKNLFSSIYTKIMEIFKEEFRHAYTNFADYKYRDIVQWHIFGSKTGEGL